MYEKNETQFAIKILSRLISHLDGGSIINEFGNQSSALYLKKWPLTTVLSDIQKSTLGKTFYSLGLWHIPTSTFVNSFTKVTQNYVEKQIINVQ